MKPAGWGVGEAGFIGVPVGAGWRGACLSGAESGPHGQWEKEMRALDPE